MHKKYKKVHLFLWTFLKIHKWKIYGIFFAIFLASLTVVSESYLLKLLIDKISTDHNNFDFFGHKEYLVIMILFITLNILTNFLWRGVNYLSLKTFPQARLIASSKTYSYLAAHSHQYFSDNMAGDLVSKIQNISESVENIFSPSLSVLYIFITIAVAIVASYTISIYFSLAILTWVIFFVFISLRLSKGIIKHAKDLAQLKCTLNGKYIDSIANIFNVKIFSRKGFEKKYLKKTSQQVMNKDIELRSELLILWFVQGVLCSLILGIVIFILVFLRSRNMLTTGDFVFIISITISITHQIFGIAELISKIFDRIGTFEQALSVIYAPHKIVNYPNAISLQIEKAAITFKDVEFGYSSEKKLYKKLSFEIPAYQKIGIVCYSGGGKTTLINLLLRLFEVQKGEIQINGQNINSFTQESLRENIAFIPQNPVLFHRSFMENIRYGKLDATDEQVREAAIRSYSDNFILTANKGYDTMVGEGGVKISAGQRQRIAIARAILKNAPVLILDEATSSLDSITELLIQESLRDLMSNKTVIVIAHRLSTLLMMDRILVFDKGKIIEDGFHNDLLQQNGLYAELWKKQIGGF